jgi:hypothetical protein
MTNGYDAASLKATGLNEANSSADMTKMSNMKPVAVRDARFTRTGIGYRTQADAANFKDYPGGTANRKRGMNERELPWETAQEAVSPQIRPRDTLEPSGLKENGLSGLYFPCEGDARMALAVLSQFVDGGTLTKLQAQIEDTYGDPMATPPPPAEDSYNDSEWDGWVDEAAYYAETGNLLEAPAKGSKKGGLDFSAFVFAGGKRYAIDTPANAQKALTQVKKTGEDADVAKVTKAVKKRYPKMEIE